MGLHCCHRQWGTVTFTDMEALVENEMQRSQEFCLVCVKFEMLMNSGGDIKLGERYTSLEQKNLELEIGDQSRGHLQHKNGI